MPMNTKSKKIDELDIYGDQVKEALTNPPSSLYFIGNWLVLIFLCILLLLTYVIRFPDIISADVVVTSKSTPIKIISEKEGILSNLFVADKDSVRANERLAVISSTISLFHIEELEKFIEDFDMDSHPNCSFPDSMNIGDIRTHVNDLENAYREYKNYISHMPEKNEIRHIKKQIQKLKVLDKNLRDQMDLQEEQLKLFENDFERNTKLLEEGVVSFYDLEQKRVTLLDKQKELQVIKFNKSNNLSSITNLKRELSRFDVDENINLSSHTTRIQNSADRVRAEVSKWKRLHVLNAQQSGVISFLDHFKENQYIPKNTTLFSISKNNNQFIGEGFLSLRNSGKVKSNQRAIIKLDAFPEKEFGSLQGYVNDIASVSNNDELLLKIEIPQGLTTNYSKTLPYKPTYKGTVEIMTEDLRLLDRIFFELRNIFIKYKDES